MLTVFLEWIADWPLVAFVRTDRSAYATINGAHILGISLLVGAIVSSDVRIAGLWKADRWREGLETCVPVAAAGLALAIVTGTVLFSVRGEHYLSDPAFLIKVPLVVAGLANVLIFRRAMARRIGDAPSAAMRVSAISSMVIWISAIFAGRWIAFTN